MAQSIQNGPRSVIVIPAQGIIECRDALTKLLEEFGTTDDDSGQFHIFFLVQTAIAICRVVSRLSLELAGFNAELPEGKQFRVDNKVFYFDIGQNDRGVFMRISEVYWKL